MDMSAYNPSWPAGLMDFTTYLQQQDILEIIYRKKNFIYRLTAAGHNIKYFLCCCGERLLAASQEKFIMTRQGNQGKFLSHYCIDEQPG